MHFDNTYSRCEYEKLAARMRALGVTSIVRLSDTSSDYMRVDIPLMNGSIVNLVVYIREWGCFAFVKSGQLLEFATIDDLWNGLHALAHERLASDDELTHRLKSIAIRSLSAVEWQQEEWAALQSMQSLYGWEFLDTSSAAHLESRYSTCVARRMSFPLGRISSDAVAQATWDIKRVFRLGNQDAALFEQGCVEAVLRSLQAIVSSGCVIARQQNRRPVLFNPHRGSCRAVLNCWHVQVLPVEGDVAFVDADCSFGYIGQHLSGTVTAFGDNFVSTLEASEFGRFATPVRIFPPTRDEWDRKFVEEGRKGWSRIPVSETARIEEMIASLVSDIDIEPLSPSRTWDVSVVTDGALEMHEVQARIVCTLSEAMMRHSFPGASWFVLSDPYPICKVDVPLALSAHDPSEWPIPIVSRFSNSYFIRSDFREAILCFNRLGQLCLFGEGMSTVDLSVPLIA